MSSDYNSISQFFSHPLVLLLIGAAISGVLIPYFTNRAANYQKGLEIKTDLVRRINEGVTRIVIALDRVTIPSIAVEDDERYTGNSGLYSQKKDLQQKLEEINKELDQELEQTRRKKLDQKHEKVSEEFEELDKTIQNIEKFYAMAKNEMIEWIVTSAVIGSQIKSYFPGFGEKTEPRLMLDVNGEKHLVRLTWDAFAGSLLGASTLASEVCSNIFSAVKHKELDWHQITNDLYKEKEEIILQIQNSPVSGLSEHLFSRFIRKFTRPESKKPDAKIDHDSNP